MYSLIQFSILAICLSANGTPLESPTEDFSKFFESSRIVGGVEAPDNYTPYKAALVYGLEVLPLYMCGGSIVSDRHLLTAAHCIDPFILEAYSTLVLVQISQTSWSRDGEVVRFKDYSNHPKWNRTIIKYDIGILCTTTPLNFNKRKQPIALNYDWIDAGTKSFVAGWGRTSAEGGIPRELQLLDVTTISPEDCAKKVKEASQGLDAPPIYAHAEICTFHSVGFGMCRGDSGSALVSRKDRRQIGVASWAFPCAVGAPDMFTRIYGMKNFLRPKLGYDKL